MLQPKTKTAGEAKLSGCISLFYKEFQEVGPDGIESPTL
jgi:hypothetical protein